MSFGDRNKRDTNEFVDRGERQAAASDRILFTDTRNVGLVWPGKHADYEEAVFPLESIEIFNEPIIDPEYDKNLNLFSENPQAPCDCDSWTNKLIWGDNKPALSSLKNGSMKSLIDGVGGFRLIYIDPPFHVGVDFPLRLEIGETPPHKDVKSFEQMAYRDKWTGGVESYLSMIYERLILMKDMLADDGSIWVHCDWKVNFMLRAVLDEIFGSQCFRNEIIWYYTNKIPDTRKRQYTNSTDTILFYSKTDRHIFNWQYDRREKPIKVSRMKKVNGKKIYVRDENGKCIYDVREERTVDNVWKIPLLHSHPEMVGYPTQKPEKLLERIILTSSNKGDLVGDFFCGSGTTLAVAQRLGRKWIGCDSGRFAIHACRKRLIEVRKQITGDGVSRWGFEIVALAGNTGQAFVGTGSDLPEKIPLAQPSDNYDDYISRTLCAYNGERVYDKPPFHGVSNGTAVVVGPMHAAVTCVMVSEIINQCVRQGVENVDVLGSEFEISLASTVVEAHRLGIGLSLKYIPDDVLDTVETEKGRERFYPAGFPEVFVKADSNEVTVSLTDFRVYNRDEDIERLECKLKPGFSMDTVSQGFLIRITKDRGGKIHREVLTRRWSDWIDYWEVDFEYGKRQELTETVSDCGTRLSEPGKPVFVSQWQTYRTRKNRKLKLTSRETRLYAFGRA